MDRNQWSIKMAILSGRRGETEIRLKAKQIKEIYLEMEHEDQKERCSNNETSFIKGYLKMLIGQ